MRSFFKLTSLFFLVLCIGLITLDCAPVSGARIKDISSLKGVRNNQLVGYGLVVGLNGTGDGSGTGFTTQSLVNMMERLGMSPMDASAKA